ncbi:para-aminobenzoic acid synthetase [Peniophora sp. CONT]|nr:para-aminobenzoic acid synthetase [Peniophora sp. CONT]
MLYSSAPRILLIDSYDSFTHNLASSITAAIPGCKVHVIHNDDLTINQLTPVLRHFHAVVVGPGPGSPDISADVGVLRDLWNLSGRDLLPIFGVCLGLQSLAFEHGARVRRLNVVKHGQISSLVHDGTGLFKGVHMAHVVRYHSLHVQLDPDGPIEELATVDDGAENGRVVMAVRHRDKPFWGVQYHPESIRTSGGGIDVIKNFWRLATAWATLHERRPDPWDHRLERSFGGSWPLPRLMAMDATSRQPATQYHYIELNVPDVSVQALCDGLGANDEESPFVVLESAAHPGRFSIIGCVDAVSPRFQHNAGDAHIIVSGVREPLGAQDVWLWLASFVRRHRVTEGPQTVPFWGGLVGYISYELGVFGVTRLSERQGTSERSHPDVNLVFVERSIVIDRYTGCVYVQTLRSNDDAWLQETAAFVQAAQPAKSTAIGPLFAKSPLVCLPEEARYKARILAAKEHLFAGDSYELCLTAHTRVHTRPLPSVSSGSSSWELYKLLQKRNPAPHAGYLRLTPSTLLSSSPERFLSYSRDGHCQLRPIKGTVRKASGITRDVAEELLSGSKKEVAENLMIVDLIRHDLHGVVGDDVSVKQFCKVEEYETVWQMVSVIEGGPPKDEVGAEVGWKVLKESLPPGSMTGAPKKRSVEILQTLEDDDRSIYSGVFGFWDIGGGGDWSVVIRSCFKHDGTRHDYERTSEAVGVADPEFECKGGEGEEEWIIGAGGAITALSDPQSEWEEMCVKLQSVLQTFAAAGPQSAA